MKEALFYEKLADKNVRCNVCRHRCLIKEGRRGICRVRENNDGKLYALNYGLTAGVGVDPIEKKPLYHFLPGTRSYSFAAPGCNFRCPWCQNHHLSQSFFAKGKLAGVEIPPIAHVRRALHYGCSSIACTYSEPTIYLEYALETMKAAKERDLANVWVSNGYMSEETLSAIIPYLDAANIDFKGTDSAYEKFVGGKKDFVVENMKRLLDSGVHLEITTLVIPGVNDTEEELTETAKTIAEELGTDVPWHISRFFPAFRMSKTPPTSKETLRKAERIGKRQGIKTIHLGNI